MTNDTTTSWQGGTRHTLRHLFLTTLAEPLGCTNAIPDAAFSYEMISDDWGSAVFIPKRRLMLLEQLPPGSGSRTRNTIASLMHIDIVTFNFTNPRGPVKCEVILATPWHNGRKLWAGRLLWVGEEGTVAAVPDDYSYAMADDLHAFRFDREMFGTPSDISFIYDYDRALGINRARSIVAAAPQDAF